MRLGEVHEIVDPSSSPDGKQKSRFSALMAGSNDLYVYDLDKRHASPPDDPRQLRRIDLTRPPTASGINVFSTDRFTTNMETLSPSRLALLEVRDRRHCHRARRFQRQGHRPRMGSRILLPLRPSGVTNIYRMDGAARTTTQTEPTPC